MAVDVSRKSDIGDRGRSDTRGMGRHAYRSAVPVSGRSSPVSWSFWRDPVAPTSPARPSPSLVAARPVCEEHTGEDRRRAPANADL